MSKILTVDAEMALLFHAIEECNNKLGIPIMGLILPKIQDDEEETNEVIIQIVYLQDPRDLLKARLNSEEVLKVSYLSDKIKECEFFNYSQFIKDLNYYQDNIWPLIGKVVYSNKDFPELVKGIFDTSINKTFIHRRATCPKCNYKIQDINVITIFHRYLYLKYNILCPFPELSDWSSTQKLTHNKIKEKCIKYAQRLGDITLLKILEKDEDEIKIFNQEAKAFYEKSIKELEKTLFRIRVNLI